MNPQRKTYRSWGKHRVLNGTAKSPDYYRARTDVIDELKIFYLKSKKLAIEAEDKEKIKKYEKSIVLLRNGVFPESENEQKLVAERMRQAGTELFQYSNEPLTDIELSSYNTWFNVHPEKVAGKQIITTSREFTVTIRGTQQDAIDTIRNGLKANNNNIVTTDETLILELEAQAQIAILEMRKRQRTRSGKGDLRGISRTKKVLTLK